MAESNESNELKKIKKLYGEKFMHLCRELFPTILEKEGLLTEILTSTFATNSRALYEDITRCHLEDEFKKFIYSKVDVEQKEVEIIEKKTPYQLLEEAGYDLYECNSEEEIQDFKKYYKHGEELCTFKGDRLDRCVVFWAVKKDAENILRENFSNPRREDEYGTSVMSIQFSRGKYSTVSIKNRYNHTVNNPDATYGNNLDRIAPGLTQSFAQLLNERGMKLDSTNIEDINIPYYVVANDGKYYKYNTERNGIYYCPGNIIINHGEIIQLEPEKQILVDCYIVDKVNKKIGVFDESIDDGFIDVFDNLSNIEVRKSDEKDARIITITNDDNVEFEIEIDKENGITGYKDNFTQSVGDDFLLSSRRVKKIEMRNIEKIGNKFVANAKILSDLKMPKVKKIGDAFLYENQYITKLNLPELEEVGTGFLYRNSKIEQIELPKIKKIGNCFLQHNECATELNLPELEQTGLNFMCFNEKINKINLPKLKKVSKSFLEINKNVEKLDLPELEQVGIRFMYYNEKINEVNCPKLKKVGDMFLGYNNELTNINLPELEETGECFLYDNKKISKIELPKLKIAGHQFLYNNKILTEINLPELEQTKGDFLYHANEITHLELPKIKKIKGGFIEGAQRIGQNIKYLKLPKNILEKQEYLKRIVDFNKGEIVETESTEEVSNDIETKTNIEPNIETINKKDIAELSKETAITTTEVSLGKRFLNKIKELFKHKENDKRGEK